MLGKNATASWHQSIFSHPLCRGTKKHEEDLPQMGWHVVKKALFVLLFQSTVSIAEEVLYKKVQLLMCLLFSLCYSRIVFEGNCGAVCE